MSKPKASNTPAAGAPPASIPATGPGSRPRKAKIEGPAARAVEKDGKVVALVLNSLSNQAAVECVTGKYTAHIVGISEGIILARQQDLPVHNQAANTVME